MAEAQKTMNSEISCVHQAEVLRFMAVRGCGPEAVLDGILGHSEYLIEGINGEVMPVDFRYLRNHSNWVSNDLSLHVFKNVARLIGGERPLFQVGQVIYSSKMSGLLGWLIRLLAVHPEWLATKTFEISERITKMNKVTVEDFNRGSGMRIRVAYTNSAVALSTLVCDYTEGTLVGFSSIFAKNVDSKRTRCACKGDPYCEYIIAWEKRGLVETFFRSTSPGFQLMQDELESAGSSAGDTEVVGVLAGSGDERDD